ncbi:MAG: hypothetical protein ACFCVC_14265 [Acidimicrobiia bacterium]
MASTFDIRLSSISDANRSAAVSQSCIIPVDAQRRGRIFLPFADDDPKTAEIISTVLMLALDTLIKDPTILEQLRS